jgi:hypothetical protein
MMQGTRAEPVRWRPRRSDGSVRARSFAATVSLLAAAGGLVGVAVHESQPWLFGGMSALAVLAAAGMSRRSVVAQILARGAAWTLFGPSALGAVVSLVFDGRFEGIPWAFAGASGLALLLGRPMLHTDQARAEFAPVRFRRWLLAGAVASVAVAAATGIIGALFVSVGELGSGSALLALTGALLASGVGVARMRAWGVLLGMLSSAVVCVTALALQHHAAGVLLATAALPGLMLSVPVLLRGRPGGRAMAPDAPAAPARRFRIDEVAADDSRVRVEALDRISLPSCEPSREEDDVVRALRV